MIIFVSLFLFDLVWIFVIISQDIFSRWDSMKESQRGLYYLIILSSAHSFEEMIWSTISIPIYYSPFNLKPVDQFNLFIYPTM